MQEQPPTLQRSLAQNRLGTIKALTGLRFFAAFVVIFVHSKLLAFGKDLVSGQYATNAVTFFFVLSGFILTYVYSDRLTWRNIPKFYFARWARIWPLHLVCLAAVIVVFACHGELNLQGRPLRQLLTQIALIHSWVPEQSWAFNFNGPSWSISTELGFYIAFPLLLLPGKRHFAPVLLSVLAMTAAALYFLQSGVWEGPQASVGWMRDASYVNPICRLADFTLGMAMGRLLLSHGTHRTNQRSFFGDTVYELLSFAFVAIAFYAASRQGPLFQWLAGKDMNVIALWCYRGGSVTVPFAVLVWVFSWSQGMFAKLMSRPLIVWLGEISFALYLIQQAVLVAVEHWVEKAELPPTVVMGVVITISLALAALLFTVVEMPCRHALICLSEGKFKSAGQAIREIPSRLVRHWIGVGAVSAILIAIVTFRIELQQAQVLKQKNDLVLQRAMTKSSFLPITFKGEAVLLNVDANIENDRLNLALLWRKLPGFQRSRFLHYTNDQHQIIAQGPSSWKIFQQAKAGELVVDQVALPLSKIPANSIIGVGFYAEGIQTVSINRGSRSMDNRRLDILKLIGDKLEYIDQD